MGRRVRRTVLPGGTRVVTERVPNARSVSLGIWVAVGSRDEPPERAGVSHFLEHLLFKGTASRDARQIAVAVDALGGEMNAYTSKEHTVFYLRVPTAGAGVALDLLVDLVAEPALRAEDVAGERTVILEELAACEDSPEDRVDDLLWRALFPSHPLGWDVLGTEATVEAMDREAVAEFFGRWYRPGNLVVAAAGAVDHAAVVEAAARLDVPGRGEVPLRAAPERPVKRVAIQRRATEQAHLALGWRGPGYRDGDRVALDVLEQVLGGGPSSRLFQEVREQRSLAYTVYASAAEFVDVGALAVYAGVTPDRAREALAVIGDIVGDLAAHGVTDEELAVAKGYLEGSMWLSLEDNPSRMSRIGWWEVTEGRVPPPEEYLAELAALRAADVARVAARVLSGPRVLAAVGPFRASDLQ
ncbi:MAG: insulinase family protein [Acidimicrobiia bacterium]|nr:insulinase family protein [Acidimicrobiia bacterium]